MARQEASGAVSWAQRGLWVTRDLTVRVNPELIVDIGTQRTAVKLYFSARQGGLRGGFGSVRLSPIACGQKFENLLDGWVSLPTEGTLLQEELYLS